MGIHSRDSCGRETGINKVIEMKILGYFLGIILFVIVLNIDSWLNTKRIEKQIKEYKKKENI